MWRRNLAIVVACMCVTALHGYSVARSNQVANYHYEPPAGARLELPTVNHRAATSFNQQLQQLQQGYQRQYKSYNPQQQQQRTVALTSQAYNTKSAAIDADPDSESVRLPLPLGVASINIAPLPLMEGASYTSSHGLTSYGTPYPQKRV